MVRTPGYDENGIKRGTWSAEEDEKLRDYILRYGHWNWRELPKYAGLSRCGKSCRLRWLNYLRPNVKRGNYTKEEEDLIIRLHEKLGNKWSAIAAELPGRTDNEIKNHWHTHLKKRLKQNQATKHELDSGVPKQQAVCGSQSILVNLNPQSPQNISQSAKQEKKTNSKLASDAGAEVLLQPQSILESTPLSPEPYSGELYSALTSDCAVLEDMNWVMENIISTSSESLGEAIGNFWTELFPEDTTWYQQEF